MDGHGVTNEKGDTMNMYRHGDVVLITRPVPPGAAETERGRLTLAEGEVTGHAHVIDHPDAILLTVPASLEAAEPAAPATTRTFLRVLAAAGVELTHEEHAALVIPPGEYEVLRQREWTDEDEPRQVAD